MHIHEGPPHGGPVTVTDDTARTSTYNGHVTPVDTLTSACQYASRPLPATPTSKTKMADRPSTSGGLASRNTVRNDFKFDKRISRDDSFLQPRAYGEPDPRPYTHSRGRPPTPECSPKTVAASRFASRTHGLEVASSSFEDERNGNIGMALGSPSHPPTMWNTWDSHGAERPVKDSAWAMTPRTSRDNSADTFEMPITRKPSSRWNLFGIFGRKQSDHTTSSTSTSELNSLKDVHKHEDELGLAIQTPLSGLKSPARSNTVSSRKIPKHKPIVIRSQTLPLNVENDKNDRKTMQTKRRGDGESERIPIALDMGPRSVPTSGPLLNVEIPDIRMERYSVMFNSVLNSNPSLLTRRQATVQKLKSIEDAVEREEREKLRGETRRATSPQPAGRRSALGLFPPSRPDHEMPHRLSPRLRSNTSPALLPSPSKSNFAHSSAANKHHATKDTSRLKYHRHKSHKQPDGQGIGAAMRSDEGTQETVPESSHFSNDQSNLILDSPTEMEEPEGYDTIKSKAWKPITTYHASPEPKWQMISPSSSSQKTPTTASSYTSSHRKRSPSLLSSSRTQITVQTEDFSDDASSSYPDGNTTKMTPVEISIARQISISRQQRKLLQPLHTGPSPSPSTSASSGSRRPSHANASPARTSPMVGAMVGVAGAAVGEKGRIAETKTSTPTLVHPPDTLGTPLALAQLRRSEQIILEGA